MAGKISVCMTHRVGARCVFLFVVVCSAPADTLGSAIHSNIILIAESGNADMSDIVPADARIRERIFFDDDIINTKRGFTETGFRPLADDIILHFVKVRKLGLSLPGLL